MTPAPTIVHWRWPQQALPRLREAGRFPMGEISRGMVYVAPTHALHQHDYHAQFELGSRRYTLHPGDVTLTPAGVTSSYELPANGFHFCVHFDALPATAPLLTLPVHWRPGSQSAYVASRLRHVIELYHRSEQPGAVGRLAQAASGSALQALLLWLALATARAEDRWTTPRAQASLEQLVAVLDERFAEPLTVPALAAQVGLSQNYLARLFRQRMGVTIQHYLLHRRIALARHLLATTRLPVKQIAAAAGLPDAQHFNKQFRRQTGISPSAARRHAI